MKQVAAQDQEQIALARQGLLRVSTLFVTSDQVLTEAEFMRVVSPHPNLIEYYGDCAIKVGDGDGYIFYILMELCTVQLSQLFAERNSVPWTEIEVLHIFSQVWLPAL